MGEVVEFSKRRPAQPPLTPSLSKEDARKWADFYMQTLSDLYGMQPSEMADRMAEWYRRAGM